MVWFFYFILWNLVGCIFIFDKLRDINIKIGNRHLNLVDIFIILRPPPIAHITNKKENKQELGRTKIQPSASTQ
jgi:hypothetical protein